MILFCRLLSFISLLCTVISLKAGPIIVGGAGESEYSIIFVSHNLHEIFESCLNFSCNLSTEERKVLLQLNKRAAKSPTPVFKTSSEMMTLYELRSVSNEVWINRDLLWLDTDHMVAYGVSDAAQLWIDILKFESSHTDSLKLKVAESLKNQIHRQRVVLEDQQSIEYILWQQQSHELRFVVRDPGLTTIDVAKLIDARVLNCLKPQGLKIYAPAWMPAATNPSDKKSTLTLNFGISWTCEDRVFNTSGLFYVNITRNTVQDFWSFDLSSVGIFVNPQGLEN